MPQTKKRAKSATRPSDYFPDINEWPDNWMGTEEDLEIGRGLVALFTPFIQHLIDQGLAKKTIKNHGNHLCMLGGSDYPEFRRFRCEKSNVIAKRADPVLCQR